MAMSSPDRSPVSGATLSGATLSGAVWMSWTGSPQLLQAGARVSIRAIRVGRVGNSNLFTFSLQLTATRMGLHRQQDTSVGPGVQAMELCPPGWLTCHGASPKLAPVLGPV